ncbi:hypothetical protein [Citrobacter youngae]|uniref:hypothetical protein n=1 Tax=Citrobacter youngae TaxID=133448 RepID=UPI0039B3F800
MPPDHCEGRIPVRNSDPVPSGMRNVPEHTTWIEQKNTRLLYGCNGVADHQLTVRRRSIDF